MAVALERVADGVDGLGRVVLGLGVVAAFAGDVDEVAKKGLGGLEVGVVDLDLAGAEVGGVEDDLAVREEDGQFGTRQSDVRGVALEAVWPLSSWGALCPVER